MTQAETARVLGITQPKVSALLHGRIEGFSIERIAGFLGRRGGKLISPFGKKRSPNHDVSTRRVRLARSTSEAIRLFAASLSGPAWGTEKF